VPAKTKRDEGKWAKAKAIAEGRGQGDDYALIMGIYKRMKPDYFKKAGVRVAAVWRLARRDEALWQQFLDDVYEGGRKLVRNTNRDTRDRYPQVEVLTLLRTDKSFRKLLRGQFGRWRAQRERAGPLGRRRPGPGTAGARADGRVDPGPEAGARRGRASSSRPGHPQAGGRRHGPHAAVGRRGVEPPGSVTA
jgi:hypothetical protein